MPLISECIAISGVFVIGIIDHCYKKEKKTIRVSAKLMSVFLQDDQYVMTSF